MKVIAIIIFILFFNAQLKALNIKGRVVDVNDNPIEFANVVLLKDSLFITGTVTNDAGLFEIINTDDQGDCIEISMIGYEKHIMHIPPTGDFGTIVLKESQIRLGEVVVKANIPITRLKGGVLTTTVENSVLSKMGTAADVLTRLPLVTESDGKYIVFGKGSPLIYINGKLVRNSSELQRLSSESIRSIEVITNPGGQYSSEVQSVIRIKTIPNKGDGFSTDLNNSMRISHFARNTSDFSLNYRHNNLDIFANGYFYFGKRLYLDQVEMETSNGIDLNQSISTESVQSFNDVSGKIGINYQISDNHFIGTYYSLGTDYSCTRANPLSQVDLFNSDKLISSETIMSDWLSRTTTMPIHEFNLYYNGSVNKLNFDFNADFTQSHSENNDIHDEKNINNPNDNHYIVSEGLKKNRLLAERLILAYPVWKGKIELGEEYTNSLLNYGYNYEGVFIDDSFTKIQEDNLAAFATLSQAFGNINLSAGMRYEHLIYKYFKNGTFSSDQSKTYNNLFPTLSLSTILDKVHLSLSFTNRTLRPSYYQLDGGVRYVNNFTYQSGNSELKPVKMYTVQLMGMWKWLFAQASVRHDVNSIFTVTAPMENESSVKMLSFDNIPHHTQMQVAIGAQPHIGYWNLQATAGMIKQFYSTSYLEEEQNLDKPLFSFTFNNSLSLPKEWILEADFNFTTKGNIQNVSTSATNKVDLMLKKTFFNGNFSVSIYANDIFDGSASKSAMYSGDIITKIYNKAEQRNVRITLRYKFNTARSKYRGTGSGNEEKKRM